MHCALLLLSSLWFLTKTDTAVLTENGILTENFNRATFWCYSELPSDMYLMTVEQMRSIFFIEAFHD